MYLREEASPHLPDNYRQIHQFVINGNSCSGADCKMVIKCEVLQERGDKTNLPHRNVLFRKHNVLPHGRYLHLHQKKHQRSPGFLPHITADGVRAAAQRRPRRPSWRKLVHLCTYYMRVWREHDVLQRFPWYHHIHMLTEGLIASGRIRAKLICTMQIPRTWLHLQDKHVNAQWWKET